MALAHPDPDPAQEPSQRRTDAQNRCIIPPEEARSLMLRALEGDNFVHEASALFYGVAIPPEVVADPAIQSIATQRLAEARASLVALSEVEQLSERQRFHVRIKFLTERFGIQ